jgi:hypothetical protein
MHSAVKECTQLKPFLALILLDCYEGEFQIGEVRCAEGTIANQSMNLFKKIDFC